MCIWAKCQFLRWFTLGGWLYTHGEKRRAVMISSSSDLLLCLSLSTLERLKSSHGWSIQPKQIRAAQLFPWIILGNRKGCNNSEGVLMSSISPHIIPRILTASLFFPCHSWVFGKKQFRACLILNESERAQLSSPQIGTLNLSYSNQDARTKESSKKWAKSIKIAGFSPSNVWDISSNIALRVAKVYQLIGQIFNHWKCYFNFWMFGLESNFHHFFGEYVSRPQPQPSKSLKKNIQKTKRGKNCRTASIASLEMGCPSSIDLVANLAANGDLDQHVDLERIQVACVLSMFTWMGFLTWYVMVWVCIYTYVYGYMNWSWSDIFVNIHVYIYSIQVYDT